MSTNYDFIKIGALVCPPDNDGEIVYITDIIGDTIVVQNYGTGVGSYKREELRSLASLPEDAEMDVPNDIEFLKASGHRIFLPLE